MIIVAKDGSGDFTSLQAAVDALPENRTEQETLLVKAGEYRERTVIHRNHLRIIGEDRGKTVITWSACAKDQHPDGTARGTFLSASLIVTGEDVEMENLTIRNDAGDGDQVGQAVALYAAGDRGVWRNCNLIAHQDTVFCGPLMPKVVRDIGGRAGNAECVESVGNCPSTRSRQYFENCLIRGDVDFIFGPYRCWFEGCTLFLNERGGWYTAANTPEEQDMGLVFHNCELTGACAPGAAFLGRPWRKFARTVFLSCRMDEHVAPVGFADWDEERRVTERYGEYGTTGERADLTARHPGMKRMTEAEARAVREQWTGMNG